MIKQELSLEHQGKEKFPIVFIMEIHQVEKGGKVFEKLAELMRNVPTWSKKVTGMYQKIGRIFKCWTIYELKITCSAHPSVTLVDMASGILKVYAKACFS
jgi:hypothetical protein